MSNTYLVNWSDGGKEEAQEIVSETPKGAYQQFVEENIHRSISVSVWSEGEGSALDKFDEHIVNEPDEVEMHNFMSEQNYDSNIVVPRRSRWSFALFITGLLLFVLGFGCVVFYLDGEAEGSSELLTVAIVGFAGGLQALLFGFLIDVFTDIRWYLQKIANKDL